LKSRYPRKSEKRPNGVNVPHIEEEGVFVDPFSGDRIWFRELPQFRAVQLWAYEEYYGITNKRFARAVVSLGVEELEELVEYLATVLYEMRRQEGE